MIPKRIIQTGTTWLQPVGTNVITSALRRLHPGFEYDFYDDQRVERFIEVECPEYRSLFKSFKFPIQKYDLFRYLVVYKRGGFYFDLDVMVSESIATLLEEDCVFTFEGLTLSHVLANDLKMPWEMGNYAFGASPGNPFLAAIIANCVRAHENPQWVKPMMHGSPAFAEDQYWVLNSTGPGLVSRTFAENPELTKAVTVLMPEDVCNVETWHCFGRYGVHLMEGSWRPHSQRLRRYLARKFEAHRQDQVLKQRKICDQPKVNGRVLTWGPHHTLHINTLTQQPKVSVLIPAYNAEKTLADTLRSVLNQTWKNLDIIVIDDGSSDNTLRVAESFRQRGVRTIPQENRGAAAARNAAFSYANGDYIQWLDADDLLAPNKIALQLLSRPNLGKRKLLSSSWGQFLYRTDHAHFRPTPLWRDLNPLEWLLCKMDQNTYMQTATWLVPRELSEQAGPWDERLLSDDDGEYFCRVLMASDGVHFVKKSKVYYRSPGLAFGGLSYVGQSNRKIDAHWLSMKLHIGYLRAMEESPRVHNACVNFLQTSMLYFYPDYPEIVSQAQALASEMGGALVPPALSWKYAWMKRTLGWERAKVGREMLLKLRWSTARRIDHLLWGLSRSKLVED